MSWFFSAGTRLHFTLSGEGPLLLLLHDGFYSSKTWAPVLPFLKQTFSCVTWDRQGYGKSSSGPDIKADIDDGVEEFSNLVDHLDSMGLETSRLLVCGHCMGGAIAARWAHLHPDQISGLVLEATGFYSDALLRRKVDLVFRPWADLPKNLRKTLVFMHGPIRAPEVWNHITTWDGDYIASTDYDLRPTLAAINSPCLLITGDKDVYFKPEHTNEGLRHLPHGELWIPEGIGHDVHREIPEEFAEYLIKYFSTLV